MSTLTENRRAASAVAAGWIGWSAQLAQVMILISSLIHLGQLLSFTSTAIEWLITPLDVVIDKSHPIFINWTRLLQGNFIFSPLFLSVHRI
jgi:hypothetical protein